MAAEVVVLIASVLVVHGVHSSIPPKFIKASYGVQKALYAKNFGYSLIPIPTYIQRQAHPPKTLPLVGHAPIITARKGRGYKYYRPRGPPRRRKRPPVRRRPPSSYGVPIYATKYKNYVPYRRPPSKPGRYKKRRPYRAPPRRPPPYVDVHHDIDDYEQEIPDDYDEYDSGDRGEYSYIDVPTKRLPLQYDKDFLNRHADLYNRGYNPGPARGRPADSYGDYSLHRVRTRIRYQNSKGDNSEVPEKENQEPQETLWPGEVTNANTHDSSWHDQTGAQSQSHNWPDSSGEQSQRSPWYDVNTGKYQDDSWSHEVLTPSPTHWQERENEQPHEWYNHPRPPRLDHQWDVYQPKTRQWNSRPTSAPEVRSWTTSLRPKPLSAAVAVPSRPVVPRETQQTNHQSAYTWDTSSQHHHQSRPRYQSHYSEAAFSLRDSMDRKLTESRRNQRGSGERERDIGFGEGMEVIDDGVAGWKVKK